MIIEPYEGNSYTTFSSNLNDVDLKTQSTIVTSSLIVSGSPATVSNNYNQTNLMTQSVNSDFNTSYGRYVDNSSSSVGYISNSTRRILPADYIPPVVPADLRQPTTRAVYQYSSSEPTNTILDNDNLIIILLGVMFLILLILLLVIFI